MESGPGSRPGAVSEGVASAKDVSGIIEEKTGYEVRPVTLGHVQRGGSPTAYDRILASRLGAAAVDATVRGQSDKMVGVAGGKIKLTPFIEACRHCKEKNVLGREIYKLTRILAT